MALKQALRREMRVAFSRRAQPPLVRVLKWIVLVGISAWLWRSAWFWWWIPGAPTTGVLVHCFWRWKTHGWTRPWIGWDDVEATRDPDDRREP
jgi:hypothetical protein